jgi:hypothetical protein
VVFALAEILRLKKFWQTDDLNAASSSVGDALKSLGKILLRLRSARHLDERDAKFFRRQECKPRRLNIAFAKRASGFSYRASAKPHRLLGVSS